MVSAKQMTELADKSIRSKHLESIEAKIKRTAESGRYYVKLWEGKSEFKDTQLIFVEQYDMDTLSHVTHMGYDIVTMEDKDTMKLYIGWGYGGSVALQIAVKADLSKNEAAQSA